MTDLTRSELDALAAYAKYGSVEAAARALFLSPSTVSGYLHVAYHKLDVHRAAQAFRVLGWLRTPDEVGE